MHGAAAPLSGLACHGRKTREACHLFSIRFTDFGAFDQACGRADRAGAGTGLEDFEGAGHRFFGRDWAADVGVDVAQLPPDQRQAGLALLDHKAELPGPDAVQKAGPVLDQGLARDLQLFEFAQGFRHWCLWSQVRRRPRLRQHPCVHRVGLRPRPRRSGKPAGLQRVHPRLRWGKLLTSGKSPPKRGSWAAWVGPVAS